ncbi:MAG: biotin--[acetyl-CoA-carboxylase] ligase [Puniceicoccales bacterium]|jgi:BirA family biotin operon repressor/biotin-[acetyl-CoA-carboxylase] ligase|nr:biotin--[acetyl-CoA-carboxylase] ligase [Puniceicoccales bacterium]
MKIFRYDSIDSTNSECFRKFDQGEALPFAIIAKTQTQGRGQFERTWYSADKHNLYISFGFYTKQPPQEFQNFSIIVAENLVTCLTKQFGIHLTVKAPNDIYCDGKKLGGILTESRIVRGEIIFAVSGIGLNVAGDLTKFPNELQLQATTLGTCCKKEIALQEIENIVIKVVRLLLL